MNKTEIQSYFTLLKQFVIRVKQTVENVHYRGGSRISSQGGVHLKKLRRAEGGSNIFGVFRVKNHDFTPKNHIFSNCGGRREHFWGISYEKSRFYANKFDFFQFQGGRAPPWIRPCISMLLSRKSRRKLDLVIFE